MFGPLGVPELIFIFGLALLIFGPRKLPEIGRTIGRSLAEFRKATTDLKRSLNAEMIEAEIRQSDPRQILSDQPKADAAADQPPTAKPEPDAGAPAMDPADEADPVRPEQAPGTVSRGSVSATDEDASVEDATSPEDAAVADYPPAADQTIESKAL